MTDAQANKATIDALCAHICVQIGWGYSTATKHSALEWRTFWQLEQARREQVKETRN